MTIPSSSAIKAQIEQLGLDPKLAADIEAAMPQAMGQQPAPAAPAAPAPGGVDHEELEQMLSQLSPEELEQLLAEVHGGAAEQLGPKEAAEALSVAVSEPGVKTASAASHIKQANYIEGFLEAAAESGFSVKEASEMYLDALVATEAHNEKVAFNDQEYAQMHQIAGDIPQGLGADAAGQLAALNTMQHRDDQQSVLHKLMTTGVGGAAGAGLGGLGILQAKGLGANIDPRIARRIIGGTGLAGAGMGAMKGIQDGTAANRFYNPDNVRSIREQQAALAGSAQ